MGQVNLVLTVLAFKILELFPQYQMNIASQQFGLNNICGILGLTISVTRNVGLI